MKKLVMLGLLSITILIAGCQSAKDKVDQEDIDKTEEIEQEEQTDNDTEEKAIQNQDLAGEAQEEKSEEEPVTAEEESTTEEPAREKEESTVKDEVIVEEVVNNDKVDEAYITRHDETIVVNIKFNEDVNENEEREILAKYAEIVSKEYPDNNVNITIVQD